MNDVAEDSEIRKENCITAILREKVSVNFKYSESAL